MHIYKRIILDPESVQNESDIMKSTILLHALQTCVDSDTSCFESVLNVLKVLGRHNKSKRY